MSKRKHRQKHQAFMCQMTMEGNRATLDVSGTIGWDTQAVEFNDKVQAAKEAGCTSLTIRINSLGGYCYDGLAMGDCLEHCGMETVGVVVGTAQSMASYLLQCCSVRTAHPNATLMFHQPSAGAWGTVDEIMEQARHLTQMRDTMFSKMAARCGMTGPELSAEHQTMKIYTAEQALAHGFLDRIEGGDDDSAETDEEPERDATAKGCCMYDRRAMLIAMLGDDEEQEDEEQDEEPENEGEDQDKEQDEETGTDDKDKEPEDEGEDQDKEQDEETGTEDKDEEPENEGEEQDEDQDKDEEPEDKAKDAAPVTRGELAALLARERATMMAAMGAPASGLPAATDAPAKRSRTLTMAEIAKLPAMDRLAYLDEHPDLRAEYLRS